MPGPQWADLPWPVLTVDGQGEVAEASGGARALLGLEAVHSTSLLQRFQLYSHEGWPLSGRQLPWVRLGLGEDFRERQVWYERASGRRLHLFVQADVLPQGRTLLLRDESSCADALAEADAHRTLSEGLLGTRGPGEMAEVLAQRVAAALPAEVVLVATVDEVAGTLTTLACYGLSEEALPRGGATPLQPRSLVGRTLTQRHLEELACPAQREDAQLSPLRHDLLVGLQSLGAFPLLRGAAQCLGVLVYGRRQPGHLSPLEAHRLEALAAVGACALQRAELQEREQRSHRHLRMLFEAFAQLRGGLPLGDLLRRLANLACELTRARAGLLGLVDPGGSGYDALVRVAVDSGAHVRSLCTPAPGLLHALQSFARPRVLPALPEGLRTAFGEGLPAHESCLVVPLRLGETLLGHFCLLGKEGGNGFREADAEVMELFSGQASLAVGYARQLERLDGQRLLLEAVLRQAPDGILFAEPDASRFSLGNVAAERLFGRPVQQVPLWQHPAHFGLEHPDGQHYRPEELPVVRALEGETVVGEEMHLRRPDGRQVPVLANATPVLDELGELLGAVLVLQDISSIRELERLREEVGAVVVHDLRSPIQSLLLQLKRLESQPGAATAEALQGMRRSAERLAAMSEELLEASRVELHRVSLELAPGLVEEVVREVVERMRPLFPEGALSLEVAPGLPPALLDRRRLEQVLANLLDNARRYGEGRPVRVRVLPEGHGVGVWVEDQGPGIPPEDVPHVFERYFQTARARRKGRGLGLGLYISRGFVEAHGGRIRVDSTPGRGSTFRIWLPAAPAAHLEAPAEHTLH